MRPVQQRQRPYTFFMFLAVLWSMVAVLSTASPAAAQGEETAVTCFKGNPAEGNSVGTLNVTFLQNAAMSCNSTYYEECQGKCVGCYPDPESGKTVCYDNAGVKSVR